MVCANLLPYASSILPQSPILSSLIKRSPSMPRQFLKCSMLFKISSLQEILFATAVAAASAVMADFDSTTARSHLPRLKEWPKVPEDAQTPQGIFSDFILMEMQSLK